MLRPIRLAALALAFAAGAAQGAGTPRIGVLVAADDADGVECADAFVDAWRAAGARDGDFVRRVVSRGEKETTAALEDMHRENVRLIVAVGDAATTHVRDAVRDVDVVFAAPDAASAEDLRRGGGACVVTGAAPDAVAADVRRAAAGLHRLGVCVPRGDEAAAADARALGAEIEVVAADAEGATSDARAAAVAAKFASGVDAVWLPPTVTADDAASLARAFARRGLPLIGSRRAHLDAGCAVVLRADPRDLGALAAAAAARLAQGEDPRRTPVRRAKRRLVEVNLPAAARLGFVAPPTLLAWADAIWPRAPKAPR